MVYSISENDIEKFKGLAPDYILNRLKMADNYAFTDVEKGIARGIIIFSFIREEKKILLKWIYVDKKHREQCVGDNLLAAVINTAVSLGAESIVVRLPDKKETMLIYYFLWQNGFWQTEKIGREYYIPISDICKNKMIMAGSDSTNVRPLSKTELKDYRHFMVKTELTESTELGEKYPFYRNPSDRKLYDPEDSFATVKPDGKLNGLFLITHLEDKYYMPVLLMENSGKPEEVMSLIKGAAKSLYERHPDAVVIFKTFTPKSKNIVAHFFRGIDYMELNEFKLVL